MEHLVLKGKAVTGTLIGSMSFILSQTGDQFTLFPHEDLLIKNIDAAIIPLLPLQDAQSANGQMCSKYWLYGSVKFGKELFVLGNLNLYVLHMFMV